MISRKECATSLAVLALIVGCGGSGGSSGPDGSTSSASESSDATTPAATPESADTSTGRTLAIAGFWDFTTTDGSDVLYELIFEDGMIIYYDYDQDANGSGRNCYFVQSDTVTVLGNNQYDFNGIVLTMVKSGDNLLVTYPGDNTITIPPVVGIDPVDLSGC